MVQNDNNSDGLRTLVEQSGKERYRLADLGSIVDQWPDYNMAASHLVILFVVTAGQNGENLGSDEEQIILFVYLLFDVTNNKVSTCGTCFCT